MKYLEDSFKFLGKFILLALPMFIVACALQILSEPGLEIMSQCLTVISKKVQENMQMTWQEMSEIIKPYYQEAAPFFQRTTYASIILNLLVVPATHGVINKALSTGKADLTDFLEGFRNNIGRYLLYLLGTFVLGLLVSILLVVFVIILVFIASALGPLGIVIAVLLSLLLIIAVIGLTFLLPMWFPAMVIDRLGAFAALKKSVGVAKSYYWPIVGISILLGIGSSIASMFLSFFSIIPYVGTMITVIPEVLSNFIMIVFFFMIYRDRTGKNIDNNIGDIDISGEYMS